MIKKWVITKKKGGWTVEFVYPFDEGNFKQKRKIFTDWNELIKYLERQIGEK